LYDGHTLPVYPRYIYRVTRRPILPALCGIICISGGYNFLALLDVLILLLLFGLPFDVLDLLHDVIGQLIYALCDALVHYHRLLRDAFIHDGCLNAATLPLLVVGGHQLFLPLVIVHFSQAIQHLRDEFDLVLY
jgi:hypothetical protein